MSLIILEKKKFNVLASLTGFQNDTNWPFYYYSKKLQAMGYPPGYIEFFLKKLQKETSSGEDPDVALQRIISEQEFDQPIDPYQYYGGRPETVAGQWADYYKKRPDLAKQQYPGGLNFSGLSLDDMLDESRNWGSTHYSVVDRLSDGFTMVKLTSEESMMNCGNELMVCLGNQEGEGSTIRKNALSGQGEIWALINPAGETVTMADTRIDPSTGERYLQQVRGYRNRGFRHQGYGDQIDEWLGLHPEYDDRSEYAMTARVEGNDPEWDVRGGYGDDDQDDWDEDYNEEDENENEDEEMSSWGLIENDIDNLNEHYNNVKHDYTFLARMLNDIIDESDGINDSILYDLFSRYPQLIPPAIERFLFSGYPDDDPRLIKIFCNNPETAPIISQFINDAYLTYPTPTNGFNFLDTDEMEEAAKYLPKEILLKLKERAKEYSENFDILEDNANLELTGALSFEEKQEYIPKIIINSIEKLKTLDDINKSDIVGKVKILYDFILNYADFSEGEDETLFKKEYVINDNLFDYINQSFFSMGDNIFSILDLVIKRKKSSDSSIEYMINNLAPLTNDSQKFNDLHSSISYALVQIPSENTTFADRVLKYYVPFLKMFSPGFQNENPRSTTFDYDYRRVMGRLVNDNNFIEIANKISEAYPLDYVHILKYLLDNLYVANNNKIINFVMQKLYEKYGNNTMGVLINGGLDKIELEKLRRFDLVISNVYNKIIRLANKIDQKAYDLSDRIENLVLSQTMPEDVRIMELQRSIDIIKQQKGDRAEIQHILNEIMGLKRQKASKYMLIR